MPDVAGAKRGAGVGAIGVHACSSVVIRLTRDGATSMRGDRASPASTSRSLSSPRDALRYGGGMHHPSAHHRQPPPSPISAPASPKAAFVAVDTEFMRENTYWPELCLIQIADANEAAAIDPMAPGLDMTPLLDLHGRQRGRAEGLPRRRAGYRDRLQSHRQDAASAVRHADRGDGARAWASRSAIRTWSRAGLGIKLDKGARFTDWARRPLDKRQIEYAIGDVTHLVADLPQDAREAAQDRARRLARSGDGAARRSRQLRQRSRYWPGSASRCRAASPTCSAA